jgi:RNA polymerase sigma-70 factor (ECF subfamily)
MEGHEASSYHLQAAIAACHCAAADYTSTNWKQILSLYDRLVEIDPSPVVALNRAVALARVHGAQAGIDALRTLADCPQMQSYHLFYASLGELKARLGDARAAVGYYRKALALATIKSEQIFLLKKIEELLDADAAGIES